MSDGGVHAHINHLFHVLAVAKAHGIPHTYIHFFADGRDTAPNSAIKYLEQLLAQLKTLKYGELADVVGRYYAMDRDKRWERVKLAYDMLVNGVGEISTDPLQTINDRYAANETDEFLKPIIVSKAGQIQEGDTLLFLNFRSDRMRQINSVFADAIEPKPFDYNIPKNLVRGPLILFKTVYPNMMWDVAYRHHDAVRYLNPISVHLPSSDHGQRPGRVARQKR